ncbi:MAG: hypothetical protein AAB634_02485, partial [Patescibacteria group bacterium]
RHDISRNPFDQAFDYQTFPETFKVFGKRKSSSNSWTLFGIEILAFELSLAIKQVQTEMKDNAPYYAHFYNEGELIVIFKHTIFTITPDRASWDPAIKYGKALGIPEEQLDFYPSSLSEEKNYF